MTVLARIITGLILAIYASAFLTMGLIRSHQGRHEQVVPSQIETLAVQPADPLADARGRGEKVYRQYCQVCHGAEGRGDGTNSPMLEKLEHRPRDFHDAKFWQGFQDREERIKDSIAKGGEVNGKSVLMPPWEHTLSEGQINDVFEFIRAYNPNYKP